MWRSVVEMREVESGGGGGEEEEVGDTEDKGKEGRAEEGGDQV